MVTIIIITIIGLAIGSIVFYEKINDIEDLLLWLLGIIICSLSFAFFGFLIALVIPTKTKTVIDTYYLKSLQDNNSVSGSFFLGSGQINGEMKYVFYYETEGGYRMRQLSYDQALIKYTNEKPKLEIYRQEPTNAFINNFSVGGLGDSKNIFYVPKGTVKQNYNLDSR